MLVVLLFLTMGFRFTELKQLQFAVYVISLIPAVIFGYQTCFMVGNLNCQSDIPEFLPILSWIILISATFLPGLIIGLIYGKSKKKDNIIK